MNSSTHHNRGTEFPLRFCNVILFFYFFDIAWKKTLILCWHWVPSLVKCQYLISGTVTGLMECRRKGLSVKEPHRLLTHFLKATAHWIKMDGGINMTTHWRAFQVALAAPEDALRNESAHSHTCTLNCKCTTQVHKINVSGVPIVLDECFLLSGNHDM